jgi:hypothetical protein
LQNDFRENGIDINKPIDYNTFQKWIYKDHNLYLTYADKSIVIATSLICLDDIGYNDSTSISNNNLNTNINTNNIISNINNSNTSQNINNLTYPSFK